MCICHLCYAVADPDEAAAVRRRGLHKVRHDLPGRAAAAALSRRARRPAAAGGGARAVKPVE